MDPVVSVVSLEDEYPATSEERTRGQLDESLLNAGPIGGDSNLESGQSSGVCSSPPDGNVPLTAVLTESASSATAGRDGDQLIRDVIHQLERQCSTTDEEMSIEIGDGGGTLPLASTLFSSTSPAAVAFEKGLSPMIGDSTVKLKATTGGPFSGAYSMWIASAKTRETLALIPPTSDGRICYTMPGVMVEEALSDSTADTLRKYCGDDTSQLSPSYPRNHSSASVQVNIPSLLELVASGDFRAAVDISGKLLKAFGQGVGKAHQPSRNTDESLKIWSLRLHLLVSIGQYNLASSELEAFGNLDGPDLYYDYYPETYRGRKGSMVPFSMRLLHAELPRIMGQHQESLARLNRILAVIRQILKTVIETSLKDGAALELWRRRQRKAQHALAKCLLAMKEFRLATTVYNGLVDEEKTATRSLSGRVHLMLGDLNATKAEFQKFQELGDNAKANAWVSMHNGYTNAFNNNFADALVDFQKATQYDPSNIYAMNNAAVALLYLGRLEEAVSSLEKAVQENPASALHEGVCTNLCTLYELESARSTQKKAAILKLVSEHRGDGFNVACLKLPP